mmetsp:Transcript_17018/g.36690  ORF Transcript_17018/g.36690 Transcript_17018/m.36690 type:complete len:244 (+) Transcript_17018:316-1047(+)
MAPAKKSSASPGQRTSSPTKHQQPPSNNTAAGEYLLERLRILLIRLQSTSEILQNWPETQGDSAKIHADTATELIASIRKIVVGLRSVERHVNGTGSLNQGIGGEGGASSSGGSSGAMANMSKEAVEAFRTSLEDHCPIPLDMLDLLDVGQPFSLNPQCYARGLMKESMRQLAGLERRKRALAMLARSIEEGMDDARLAKGGISNGADHMQTGVDENSYVCSSKRKRDDLEETESVKKLQRTN